MIKQAPHKRWPKDQQLRWKNDEKCRETAKKRKTGLDKDQTEKEKRGPKQSQKTSLARTRERMMLRQKTLLN